jgi:large subunit ribosomal protein L3
VKSVETDGYTAVQIGYGSGKNLSNAVAGHVKAAKITPKVIREVRVDDLGEAKIGDEIKADIFELGDNVDVTGTSKGKGWAGTIKRHNFMRHRKTHGGKGNTRKVGSIGSMYPQKVFKGKKMAGQMGAEQVTVKNLTVAYIDVENNLVGVKGAVPGPKKGTIIIKGVK